METIDEALAKRFGRSLVHLMKLIDPERRYSIDEHLGKAWDALPLDDQRRLYLYLLYRKWRGEGFYGTPYEIVKNCHPYRLERTTLSQPTHAGIQNGLCQVPRHLRHLHRR